MRGVILAGGTGTRLRPITQVLNKHLVPVLNRPMLEYPIDVMRHFGVENVCIVSGGSHIGAIADYFGDGANFEVDLTYRVQEAAGGIAQALGLARAFVGNDGVVVALGDNVFDVDGLPSRSSLHCDVGLTRACVFLAKAEDPRRFGVAVFEGPTLTHIEEKPENPKSDRAVTGLYVYPPGVFDVIAGLERSPRGEFEITDVNNHYISRRAMRHVIVGGFWSDAGTVESLKRTIDWAYSCGGDSVKR